ncbi:MAG: 30S ribosomal protein S12 methylthiotransferase RimO [Bacteroidia bacterium]|nr:30S ribosomal protein S12 methylthiotransferase RimO [Bacteroidia bacterium]NNK89774.1 30S ribosomal protein S12 methylthiotransferase RimO [Saprospiraceae bacterium]
MKTKAKENKVSVITLGCSKNLVDSENLVTQLQANAYEVEHDNHSEDANILIINTCGFIDKAKQESIDTILEGASLKKEGQIEKLYVTGCLSERYKSDLEKEIPEVDAYFGTLELPALLNKLNADYKHELIGERWTSTPRHYAYLKISEGCNRTCSFCAIPLMRGKHISKSIEQLVKEARNLAKDGVKELILIAQELTYYGLDIYKRRALRDLLKALSEVDGIDWIRLHYAYPSKFPLEVIEEMAVNDKICNYLDIPLQHASDPVLKSMKRQITRQEQKDLIRKIKEINPGIALRTTMLVGFPGETEEDFKVLCDYVKEMQFDRLGVFTYSHEEDTSAYDLEDNIPDEVKSERANMLMEIQQDISFNKNLQKIGKTFKVLFDRKEGDYFIGRSQYDSPEVDNEILVDANSNFARIGDFAMVEIVNAEAFDLYGNVV